jgi:2OG-Fe(II) oxygenase superfamily
MNPTIRRWKSGSPLDTLTWQQSASNEIGRARINADGRLEDGGGVQRSTHMGDSNFLVRENFIGAGLCDALCAAFREVSTRIVHRVPGFWDSRFVWHWDLLESYSRLAERMRDAQRSAAAIIAKSYALTEPIYPDLLQIMSWPVGIHMPPHADNANPDGSPHAMAHRDFSGIVYLNDDYDGGEFYFTALDTLIKPKKGMLVAFTAGFDHEHAVLRVEGSQRLTMPFFFTFDRGRADPSLL